MSEKLPPDHGMHKIVDLRGKLRNLYGLIELAEKGDKPAALKLMRIYMEHMRRYREALPAGDVYARSHLPPIELMQWFSECMSLIVGGVDASKALGLRPGDRGRRKKNSAEIMRDFDVAFSVADIMESGSSYESAILEVMKNYGLERTTVTQAYAKYAKPL